MEIKVTSVNFNPEEQTPTLDLDLVREIETLMRQRMKDEGYTVHSQQRALGLKEVLKISTLGYME